MKKLGLIVLSCAAVTGIALSAEAGPRYHARYYVAPAPYGYDDGSVPTPAGFVFQRHNARCEYPNGWNVTDFSRNINGTPRSAYDLVGTGCAAYEPIAP